MVQDCSIQINVINKLCQKYSKSNQKVKSPKMCNIIDTLLTTVFNHVTGIQ